MKTELVFPTDAELTADIVAHDPDSYSSVATPVLGFQAQCELEDEAD